MRKYKIGEMARLLGATTQTLRFYEQEGILEPQKSENGTRYYTEADISRLMAFKRYQLMDFSVQDVARHFKSGSLDSLLTQMEETSARMKQESERLLLRAQAIEKFDMLLRTARQNLGEMICVPRPTIYMHCCSLGELEYLSSQKRETFEMFMNAMPYSHICFLYNSNHLVPLQFHFAINETGAKEWNLPLDDTLCIPSGKSVRIFVRADASLWDEMYLNLQIAQVKAAGYSIDENLPVIGQQLVSEKTDEGVFLIAAIYIPIV